MGPRQQVKRFDQRPFRDQCLATRTVPASVFALGLMSALGGKQTLAPNVRNGWKTDVSLSLAAAHLVAHIAMQVTLQEQPAGRKRTT